MVSLGAEKTFHINVAQVFFHIRPLVGRFPNDATNVPSRPHGDHPTICAHAAIEFHKKYLVGQPER
jgi:hypothetical protein